MADEDLKKLYADMTFSDAALAINRQKLARELARRNEKENTFSLVLLNIQQKIWPVRPRVWISLSTAIVALVVITIGWGSLLDDKRLDQKSLEEIEQFVMRHGNHEQLFQSAEKMRTSKAQRERLSGLLIVTMLGIEANHILASAEGLVEDPRPEYRIYYLEYLLENADEEYYNLDYLEQLIDREEDPECLYLLGELLRLALSRQVDRRDYI